jgi:hypothetical protein
VKYGVSEFDWTFCPVCFVFYQAINQLPISINQSISQSIKEIDNVIAINQLPISINQSIN